MAKKKKEPSIAKVFERAIARTPTPKHVKDSRQRSLRRLKGHKR